jgi:hypothetical protein
MWFNIDKINTIMKLDNSPDNFSFPILIIIIFYHLLLHLHYPLLLLIRLFLPYLQTQRNNQLMVNIFIYFMVNLKIT